MDLRVPSKFGSRIQVGVEAEKIQMSRIQVGFEASKMKC